MELREFINKDTVYYYARTNETLLETSPKGILLEFPGLGGNSCLGGEDNVGVYNTEFSRKCAGLGIILAYVFTGPWSWMNKGAVRIADAVVDALQEKYGLENVPVVASGGSMGGLGAMIYSIESRHKITACVAACPCCDIVDRFDVIPDFPRTVISAVAGYEEDTLLDAMKTISPMHRIDDMPYIPYFISNCCEDELFPADLMDKFVEKLLQKGHNVEYVRMPGQKHGDFTPEGIKRLREFQLYSVCGQRRSRK